MEFLSPIALILLFSVAFLVVGWFLLGRFEALLRDKKEDQSLLLMQQQIDQLRVQLSHALDNNTLIQQQLGQVLGNVNERLTENVDILQRTQQSLGERLNSAVRVVGNVQKGLTKRQFISAVRSPLNCVATIANWDSQVSNRGEFP